jgi:hypothetical protein
MGDIIKLIGTLLGILKPLIAPTEYDKYAKEFWAIKEANEKQKAKIKEALASGDVAGLNVLLSELLGEL